MKRIDSLNIFRPASPGTLILVKPVKKNGFFPIAVTASTGIANGAAIIIFNIEINLNLPAPSITDFAVDGKTTNGSVVVANNFFGYNVVFVGVTVPFEINDVVKVKYTPGENRIASLIDDLTCAPFTLTGVASS